MKLRLSLSPLWIVVVLATSSVAIAAPHVLKKRQLQTEPAPVSAAPAAVDGSLLMYDHGGGVMSAANVEAIFWGSNWPNGAFAQDKVAGIDLFFEGFNGSSYQSVLQQYMHGAPLWDGYSGHIFDASPAVPDSAASVANIGAEVCRLTGNNPQASTIYFVYTDQPVTSQVYCAWHGYSFCPNGKIAQIAYFPSLDNGECNPGDASGLHSEGLSALANVSAHELMESLSDIELSAWYSNNGSEIGDGCAWTFSNVGDGMIPFANGQRWRLQLIWSNQAYEGGYGQSSTAGSGYTGAPGCAVPWQPPTSPSIAAFGNQYYASFQDLAGNMHAASSWGNPSFGLGMLTGTSPAVANLTSGGTQLAFQANTGHLWSVGEFTNADTELGMWPGTSPAIVGLSGGGYEIAIQANNGHLVVYGSAQILDTGLGMWPGTSPSITWLSGNRFEVAFQANTGVLWTYGANTADLSMGMWPGTSPSITHLSGGGYQTAFQANTGVLWATGNAGTADTGLGMWAGTSPAIAATKTNSYVVAFQANTTHLWMSGARGAYDTNLGMMPGTNPAIAETTGGFEVAFQANTSHLWFYGDELIEDSGEIMQP